jgi:hypothetical protein
MQSDKPYSMGPISDWCLRLWRTAGPQRGQFIDGLVMAIRAIGKGLEREGLLSSEPGRNSLTDMEAVAFFITTSRAGITSHSWRTGPCSPSTHYPAVPLGVDFDVRQACLYEPAPDRPKRLGRIETRG